MFSVNKANKANKTSILTKYDKLSQIACKNYYKSILLRRSLISWWLYRPHYNKDSSNKIDSLKVENKTMDSTDHTKFTDKSSEEIN